MSKCQRLFSSLHSSDSSASVSRTNSPKLSEKKITVQLVQLIGARICDFLVLFLGPLQWLRRPWNWLRFGPPWRSGMNFDPNHGCEVRPGVDPVPIPLPVLNKEVELPLDASPDQRGKSSGLEGWCFIIPQALQGDLEVWSVFQRCSPFFLWVDAWTWQYSPVLSSIAQYCPCSNINWCLK